MKTVCGGTWLKWYLQTLSNTDRRAVYSFKSGHSFVFGNGKQFLSPKIVAIPIYLGQKRVTLLTDVVTADIPLLISIETLQKTDAQINFKLNKITMLGEEIDVKISTSGHYCLPLTRPPDINNEHTAKVLFSFKFDDDPKANYKKVLKLHRQFCHPKPDALYKLIKTSGTNSSEIHKICRDVYDRCESCQRYGTKKLRPVVAFPTASDFNERLAVDLKQFGTGIHILHIVDHVTRYSSACVIKDKQKGTIVKGFLEYWIRIFGSPQSILSDNGGEFVNQELTDLAEKFNISLRSTAAESAWSNGLVEKHNGVLASIVKKVIAKEGCSLDVALHWAVCAKNCLTNVYGFSPNTLVFGRNPALPNYLENKAPANNPIAISKYIAENLRVLHTAREAALQQEACEKLKRASLRKVRSYSDTKFFNGLCIFLQK